MSIEFNIAKSKKLDNVFIVTPNKFRDLRGEIWTSYMETELKEKLLPANFNFIHDKFATSKHNVLRGIHGDPNTYKFVTCVYGEIIQVVVDCRKNSPTYMQYEKFIINKDNQKMILIPPNMGNAHYVCSDIAVYHYKCAYNGVYTDADGQFTIAWNDKRIGIDWPCKNPILSTRDIELQGIKHDGY